MNSEIAYGHKITITSGISEVEISVGRFRLDDYNGNLSSHIKLNGFGHSCNLDLKGQILFVNEGVFKNIKQNSGDLNTGFTYAGI